MYFYSLFLQIIRFSKGLGAVSNGLRASTQRHIAELGFTEETYRLPFSYREKIFAILRICQRSNRQRRNIAPDAERINRFRQSLRNCVNSIISEERRLNWEEVEIVQREEFYYAVCPCPTCRASINVWSSQRRHFISFPFTRHIQNTHDFDNGEEDDQDED